MRSCTLAVVVAPHTENPTKFGPEVRETYLALIRAGHGRLSACRAVGVHPDTMRRFARHSEEFKQAMIDAEEEAAEPVEAKLYEAALAGEPWAVKEWLTKRNRARWGDPAQRVEVEVSGTVAVEAGPGLEAVVGRVAAMQRALVERRAALMESGDIVDAVIVEGDLPALPVGSRACEPAPD